MNPPNPSIQEVNINKPYELWKNGILKGYFWYYGNSVDLVFNLKGQISLTGMDAYITVNQLLKSLMFTGTIYDFRHSKILEFSNDPSAEYRLEVNPGDPD